MSINLSESDTSEKPVKLRSNQNSASKHNSWNKPIYVINDSYESSKGDTRGTIESNWDKERNRTISSNNNRLNNDQRNRKNSNNMHSKMSSGRSSAMPHIRIEE